MSQLHRNVLASIVAAIEPAIEPILEAALPVVVPGPVGALADEAVKVGADVLNKDLGITPAAPAAVAPAAPAPAAGPTLQDLLNVQQQTLDMIGKLVAALTPKA